MKGFFKRLWLRVWFRFCIWVAVALFALMVLIRESADLSGKRSWAAVQAMLAREGESLEFQKIAPDPVPDEKNFCAIPALKDLAVIPEKNAPNAQYQERKRLLDAALPDGSKEARNELKAAGSLDGVLRQALKGITTKDYVPMPRLSQGAPLGQAADMTAWAAWLRKEGSPPGPNTGNDARDVLAALSKDDALVAELASGLDRPEAQWTPAWKTRHFPDPYFTITYPQQVPVMKLVQMLCLRSTAAARAGDAAKAHQSLLIELRLTQANMQEPFLIGTLVACGDSAITSSAVWELCDSQMGTAEDFRRLQDALRRLDIRQSLLYATRGELVFAANTSSYLKRTRDTRIFNPFAMRQEPESPALSLALNLIPDGMFDANMATIAEWNFNYCLKPLRDGGFRELLAKQTELHALIARENSKPAYEHLDETLALISIPAMDGVAYSAIYSQCLVNEAIAGCALERYRIEHGAYPDSLEAANRPGETPIPLDVISWKPMGYRKTPNGRYALWCVGFDGKDDGGKRSIDGNRPGSPRVSSPTYLGDWVWDFPAR